MLTTLHVLVAISSLGMGVTNHLRPSKALLRTSYALAGGTLSSGVMLVLFNQASIIRTCATGVLFFGVVSYLNESVRVRITQAQQENH